MSIHYGDMIIYIIIDTLRFQKVHMKLRGNELILQVSGLGCE